MPGIKVGPHPKIRFILIQTAVIAAVIFSVFCAVEIYLRSTATYVMQQKPRSFGDFIECDGKLLYTDSPEGRRLIPGVHVVIRNHFLSHKDIRMDTNSLGFRGKEIPKKKKNNELRILVLGDSITWEEYLQEEETYVYLIEKYLRERNFTRDINVINAGVLDLGIEEEMDILTEQGLSIRPDIVILAFYLNDSRPSWGFPQETEHKGWLRRHSLLFNKIYEKIKLDKWLRKKWPDRFEWISLQDKLDWKNKHQDFMRLALAAQYDWGAAWDKNSWYVIDEQLRKLKSLAHNNSFKVVVVCFPANYQVYTEFLEDYPQRTMQKKAKELGFYYLDLLPYLRNYRQDDLFFDQCHLKERANDIVGRAIADFILKNAGLI